MTTTRAAAGRAAVVLALLGLVLPIAICTPATADPGYPSGQKVRAARRAASDTATQVGGIQSQLAVLSARTAQADLALSKAAEDYDQAQVELAQRTQAAGAARAAAAAANGRLTEARTEVGQIASQTYQDGGVTGLQVLMSPSGPADVLDRAAMLAVLSAQRRHTLQRAEAVGLVATVMDGQARTALAAQQAAARTLAAARDRARRQAA